MKKIIDFCLVAALVIVAPFEMIHRKFKKTREMKKILTFVLLLLLSISAFTQSNNQVKGTLLVEKYYVSEEFSSWAMPDTTSQEYVFKQYLQVKIEKDLIVMSLLGDNPVNFFLNKYISTKFKDGVFTSTYSGLDAGGKRIFVYYIVSDDFIREAIVIEGETYGVTFYMGVYRAEK